MTIEARIPNKTYEGNGATKIWPLPFPAIEEKFVQVYVSREDGGSDLIDPSKYQVDLELKQVIFPLAGDPVASGKKLTLLRSTPIDQDLELLTNGNFFPEDIEDALDKRTMIEQEILEILRRAVKVPVWAEDPEEFGQGVLDARDRAEAAAREAKKSEDLALGYANGAEASQNAAEASEGKAATHAEAASHSALNANNSANKAKQISEGVEVFVGQASSSAAEAQTAKNAAEASAQEAKSQANNSNTSAIEAGQYAEAGEIAKNAAEFAQGNSESAAEKAKTSETNAKNSETNSKASETDAGLYAQLAEAAKNDAVAKAEEAASSAILATGEAEKAENTATQAIAAAGQANTAKTEAVAARDQAEDAKNRSVEIKGEIEAALDGLETAGVVSINGKSGMVTLTPEDVNAAPAVHTHIFPVTSVNGKTGDVVIPTGGGGTGAGVSSVNEKVGDVRIKGDTEGIATVVTNGNEVSVFVPQFPVTSVNGKSGEVRLDYYEVGASAAVHNHEVGNIVGINDLLSQKAPNVHTHEISQVNNLESRLAFKANNGHTHEVNDVGGLKPQLDNLGTELSTKADIGHTHDVMEVGGLKPQLDDLGTGLFAKADVGHTHVVSDISGLEDLAKPWIVNTVIHPAPAGMFNPILVSVDPINASTLHPENADIKITAIAQNLYSPMSVTHIPLSSIFAVVANGDFSVVVPVPYYVEYSQMDNTWQILIANSEAFFIADLGTNQAGVSKMIDPSSLQFQIKVRAL